MLIRLYSLIYFLFIPYVLAKGIYRREGLRILERLACYFRSRYPYENCLWLHAVSVGEVISVIPLVKLLLNKGEKIVLTTGTISGSETCRRYLGDSVENVFFPVDLTFVISRFVKYFRPKAVIITEVELWPNLLFFCKKNNIKISLINGRLSSRTFRRLSNLPKNLGDMLLSFDKVICQNQLYAERFEDLGLKKSSVFVSGNMKFDVKPSFNLETELIKKLDKLFRHKKIVVFGSTHPEEDGKVLEVTKILQKSFKELFIVQAPRYIQNSQSIVKKYSGAGLKVTTLSQILIDNTAKDGLIVDRFGVLNYFYSKARVAFVGGSFEEKGCHNVVEPAYFGVPVIVGPHIENFQYEVHSMEKRGILFIVNNSKELSSAISNLLISKNCTEKIKLNCRNFILSEKGGVKKTLEILDYSN